MRYGDCTWQDIEEYVEAGALAMVPFGCTEQQGPHLPVDFDTWLAEDLTAAAADRLDARGARTLVLPVVPYGPTPEHRNFGFGYVDLPVATHGQIAQAAFTSLAEQGFSQVVAWRGCGGHDLQGVVDRFNASWKGRCVVYLPNQPANEFWLELGDPEVPGGHADSFATSICMYRRPDAVRAERIPSGRSATPRWDDPELDFTEYSATGVIGDAAAATGELGRILWTRCVEWIVEYVLACTRAVPPGRSA